MATALSEMHVPYRPRLAPRARAGATRQTLSSRMVTCCLVRAAEAWLARTSDRPLCRNEDSGAAARTRTAPALAWLELAWLEGGDEGARLDDVVLDRAIRPSAVAARGIDPVGVQDARQAPVLAERGARDVYVSRIHDDGVV